MPLSSDPFYVDPFFVSPHPLLSASYWRVSPELTAIRSTAILQAVDSVSGGWNKYPYMSGLSTDAWRRDR